MSNKKRKSQKIHGKIKWGVDKRPDISEEDVLKLSMFFLQDFLKALTKAINQSGVDTATGGRIIALTLENLKDD
tara:strand:- start:583 stop:804 length:222 start_codon:yes stop_codon:yes gene_type:complete